MMQTAPVVASIYTQAPPSLPGAKPRPDTPSADAAAMLSYFSMVETILDGADAIKAAGPRYLPQFPQEDPKDYEYRRKNAKFTNVFADIVNNLAAKPFSEQVSLADATDQLDQLATDIDGQGNSLHVFAGSTFFHGIASGIDWIHVDFTRAQLPGNGRPLTRAEESAQALRPYWVRIGAAQMVAVYTAVLNGKEEFVHARFVENGVTRDGFSEKVVERVRVLNRDVGLDANGRVASLAPATWELWEKQPVRAGENEPTWNRIDGGPITIGIIPLVPFLTGRRKGQSWRFVPPMRDAAVLQIEHYQQETALKSIKELTAFPMLAGNGVAPQTDEAGVPAPVPVGPKSVLYAPTTSDNGQHGEWKFIEPAAASLKFLADDVKRTEQQLRELGRQPLTAQTGNLTVVTTAFAAQKGNSAVQAWALNLKDALEQAMRLTCRWLNEAKEPSVNVHTDFGVELADDNDLKTLATMRNQRDISRETYWAEVRRRNILGPDFDPVEEEKRLAAEPAAADMSGNGTTLAPPTDI